MAAASKTSTKRPCEDEAEVKINSLKPYTCINEFDKIFKMFSCKRLLKSVACLPASLSYMYLYFICIFFAIDRFCQLLSVDCTDSTFQVESKRPKTTQRHFGRNFRTLKVPSYTLEAVKLLQTFLAGGWIPLDGSLS